MQRRDPEFAAVIDFLENDILPTNNKDARKILLTSDNFYRGTQRGYSSKPLNIALLNVF